MAIDWGTLESQVKSFLEGGATNENRTLSETCAKLDSLYIDAVKGKGAEQYGNKVASISTGPLKASLESGMNSSFQLKTGGPSPLNSTGCTGLVSAWGAAQMETMIPPPPSFVVVTNVITNPGTPPVMNVSLNNLLQSEIMKAFKQHAQTIAGICTGLVMIGTVPTPTPFPWTGIK